MGTGSAPGTRLAEALFKPVQQRLLALLFGQPGRSFRSAEVIALADSGTDAVHRQLVRLAESGLVTVTRVGNQKYYQANRDSLVFSELHGLVVKTIGLVGPLEEALASQRSHPGGLRVRLDRQRNGYGPERRRSDGDQRRPPLLDLYSALQEAEAILQRPVHVNLMTADEWKRKLAGGTPFATKVQTQPKIWLVGSADDLA